MAYRSLSHAPPFHVFPDTAALPSALFGPVDCSYGFHLVMASLCFFRRSCVHPADGLLWCLQYLALLWCHLFPVRTRLRAISI